MNKNLSLLTLSQVFGFTAATITVFLSGIIGSQITSIKSLSTLPTALYVVGTAIFTILAARIMSKIGRRLGFIFAALGSSAASLLAAFAISQQNFILFCISCLILGMGAAFNHQYRFAAAESVEKEKAPRAISILMLAGVVAAFLGISSANYAKNLIPDHVYVGSYLLLVVFTFMPAIFLFFYKNKETTKIEFNNLQEWLYELDGKIIHNNNKIETEAGFNMLVSCCDIIYSVYSNPQSSGLISKAIRFNKPILYPNDGFIPDLMNMLDYYGEEVNVRNITPALIINKISLLSSRAKKISKETLRYAELLMPCNSAELFVQQVSQHAFLNKLIGSRGVIVEGNIDSLVYSYNFFRLEIMKQYKKEGENT